MNSCWQTLGLPEGAGAGDIRRAYASLIRVHRPDGDPQAFSAIREAYEEALAWTRYAQWEKEAEAAEEGEEEEEESSPGAAVDVVQDQAAAAEPAVATVLAPAILAPASPPESGPLRSTADEARERAVQVVNAGAGEGRLLLQENARWIGSQDIDAQLDYEAALISGFATHPAPDLAVLLDTALAQRWEERFDDLVQIAGYHWAEELRVRTELARQAVYAASFSSNAWVRRLFRSPPRGWVGLRPDMEAAEAFAAHWQELQDASSLEPDAAAMKQDSLRRMRVFAIPSTDLLLGAMVGLAQWARLIDGPLALVLPACWFVGIVALCAANRRLLEIALYRKVAARLVPENFFWTVGMALAAAVMTGIGVGLMDAVPLAAKIAGGVFIAVGAFWMAVLWARFFWNVLAGAERVLLFPWTVSRQASDSYLFSQALAGRLPLDSRPSLRLRFETFRDAWAEASKRSRERRRVEAEQKAERKRMGIQGPSFLRQYWVQILVMTLIIVINVAKLFR